MTLKRESLSIENVLHINNAIEWGRSPPIEKTRSDSGGSKPKKHYRISYATAFKIACCDTYRSLCIQASVLKHFNFSLEDQSLYVSATKRVYHWQKSYDKPISMNSTSRRFRSTGITASLSSDDESTFLGWILYLRGEGVPVSALILSIKATEIYRESHVYSV
jgi:hypothetical protein